MVKHEKRQRRSDDDKEYDLKTLDLTNTVSRSSKFLFAGYKHKIKVKELFVCRLHDMEYRYKISLIEEPNFLSYVDLDTLIVDG